MSFHLLKDKKVLVTAGPTRETIDTFQYISSHSSGFMGYAVAEEFLKQGAHVMLVSGPGCFSVSHPNLTVIHAESGIDMYMACCLHYEESDIVVFSAAVADYRPVKASVHKSRKNHETFVVELVRNIDIASEFAKFKSRNQVSVGIVVETNNEGDNIISQLKRKNLDLLVANSVITTELFKKDHTGKSTTELARALVREVHGILSTRQLVKIIQMN